MEASKLTISEETMKKANKTLSNKKKGDLRLKKLREAANAGKLDMCKSKGDIAELVGYSYRQRNTSGYQWVKYKIDKGWIKETIYAYEDGVPVYEYKFVDKDKKENRFPEPSKQAKERAKAMHESLAEQSFEKSAIELNRYPTLTIYRGDTTIVVEDMCEEYVVRAIEATVRQERLEKKGEPTWDTLVK